MLLQQEVGPAPQSAIVDDQDQLLHTALVVGLVGPSLQLTAGSRCEEWNFSCAHSIK